ncbi:hypothetical protein RvY_03310 [Ramazzottius varieornatus]|uniref:Uncharacterized protein n=1 Tax=Ramazzottius varieornatus TaxID=947166 RepID=A0A1D1URC6_RAMVA|nr:hypothetical protein RvY_03310 [Ramazzottius varieornatus]
MSSRSKPNDRPAELSYCAAEAAKRKRTTTMLRLMRVWPDEYTDKPKTGNVLVASLQNPKDIPAVMSLLKDLFPLPELRHLKRVRRVSALASSPSSDTGSSTPGNSNSFSATCTVR